MKKFYYKFRADSPTGISLVSLLDEGDRCDDAASAFAKEHGADSYIGDINAEFGGCSALIYPAATLLPKHLFTKIPSPDGDNDPEFSVYVPFVEFNQEIMAEDKASYHIGSFNKTVSRDSKTFRQVMMSYTRKKAAEVAGFTLVEPSVEQLLHPLKVDRNTYMMIRAGAPLDEVLPQATPELKQAIVRSLDEDDAMITSMDGRKFKLVTTACGNRKAIRMYNQMQALPVVPQGSISYMLGFGTTGYRCGCFRMNEYFYVESQIESSCPDMEPATKDDVYTAKELFDTYK